MQQIYRRAPMPKCDFSKVTKQREATLMKSHFGKDVHLLICCIFSQQLLIRTPLGGCCCILKCDVSETMVFPRRAHLDHLKAYFSNTNSHVPHTNCISVPHYSMTYTFIMNANYSSTTQNHPTEKFTQMPLFFMEE